MSEQLPGEELFSARVKAGSRTYFIDVLRAENGAKYLKLSESREGSEGERREHHRVMVFEENICEFIRAITEAMPFMRPDPLPSRIQEMRRQHPRAYEKWTDDEDARLRVEFSNGTDRTELARMFQRQRSAVKSRLQKLGLLAQPK
jgi:hypothetical protein